MPESLSDKLDRLKTEFSLGRDSQGQVLLEDERILALTHIFQQEFIIYNRAIHNLDPLGKIIDWSFFNNQEYQVMGPSLRRAILVSVSTYGSVFFTSSQGVGIADATKQYWINRISAIAEKVEKGVNDSMGVRLTFYDLRDTFFARCGNFIVGFGIQDHQLHSKVLSELNNTNYLMRTRLKCAPGAYEELNDAFGMNKLVANLSTQSTQPDGFNQANQAGMVEMLFKFYQGIAF